MDKSIKSYEIQADSLHILEKTESTNLLAKRYARDFLPKVAHLFIAREQTAGRGRQEERLMDEVIFLEEKMIELKNLPFVQVHPKNPAMQKTTSAAKLYKECSQSYMNAIRILSSILHKVESTAQDDLMKLLEEFN